MGSRMTKEPGVTKETMRTPSNTRYQNVSNGISPCTGTSKCITMKTDPIEWNLLIDLFSKFLGYKCCLNCKQVSTVWNSSLTEVEMSTIAARDLLGRQYSSVRRFGNVDAKNCRLIIREPEKYLVRDEVWFSVAHALISVTHRVNLPIVSADLAAAILSRFFTNSATPGEGIRNAVLSLLLDTELLAEIAIFVASKFQDCDLISTSFLLKNRGSGPIEKDTFLKAELTLLQTLKLNIPLSQHIYSFLPLFHNFVVAQTYRQHSSTRTSNGLRRLLTREIRRAILLFLEASEAYQRTPGHLRSLAVILLVVVLETYDDLVAVHTPYRLDDCMTVEIRILIHALLADDLTSQIRRSEPLLALSTVMLLIEAMKAYVLHIHNNLRNGVLPVSQKLLSKMISITGLDRVHEQLQHLLSRVFHKGLDSKNVNATSSAAGPEERRGGTARGMGARTSRVKLAGDLV